MKQMYILVAVIILSMISGVLWLTDAVWVAKSNATFRIQKLSDLDSHASRVHVHLLQGGFNNRSPQEKVMMRHILTDFQRTLLSLKDFNNDADWISNRLMVGSQSDSKSDDFNNEIRGMVETINLLLKARSSTDQDFHTQELLNKINLRYFSALYTSLQRERATITAFGEKITTLIWFVVPFLGLILWLIWWKMIGPMIARQYLSYKKLRASEANALKLADQAHTADVAKTQFLTVLSHELRTPLNGILGISEHLVHSLCNKTGKRDADEILQKGRDLSILVDELIAIAETKRGADFDVSQIMATVRKRQMKTDKATSDICYQFPKNFRILIADDNKTNLFVLQKMITRMGGKSDTAENGLQVVQSYLKHAYDLLLLDIDMPIMTGEEALQEIRVREMHLNASPAIAIAITANTLDEQRQSYQSSGFDACLGKPLNISALSDQLRQLISKNVTMH